MPHAADQQLINKVARSLNLGVRLGVFTDTNVAAANTVAGLKAAVDAAVLHADQQNLKSDIKRAIDSGEALGILTDALINPLTTTAGLIALAGTADSGATFIE